MRRNRWAFFLPALIALGALTVSLAGCGGGGGSSSSSSSSSTAMIIGVVEDQQTNSPIKGATVQANGGSVTTPASGAFQLTVPVGSVTVTVSAPGYQTRNFPAVADKGQTTDIGVVTLLNADTNPPAPPV